MALNFLVNLLLILGTNRLAGRKSEAYRIIGAASLGAAYAAGCMMQRFSAMASLQCRILQLGLMSVLAFGIEEKGREQGGIFVLLTMALGGTALAVGKGNNAAIAVAGILVWLLSEYAFGGKVGRNLIPVQIRGERGTVSITALQDTGNELRDPVSGERVLVIGEAEAKQLTGLTHQQLQHPLESLGALPGLRLIPYQAVGAEHGMMLGMRFSQVRIGERERPTVVAFAPQALGGEQYQALAGGII